MKTTRINCGLWAGSYVEIDEAARMFGPGGTQANRRWFYRLHERPEWRRKGRRAALDLLFYFRDSKDAVWFTLSRSKVTG